MKTIQIADMHWGKVDPKKYYNEMHNFIINNLKNMDFLDIIFIAGDVFDSKHYLYSQTMIWFTKFYGELLYVAKQLDCKIVIIEGTRTHDSFQYSIIHELYNSFYDATFIYECEDPANYCNFEVLYFDTVDKMEYYCECDETNYNILLIPEEYIVDQDKYYEKVFKDKYHYIIGHGMIDKIWYAKNKKEEKDKDVLGPPVFNVKDFKEISERTYFGHVHCHKYYGDDTGFTYIGPPSAWEFSSTKDYGYIYTEFDKGKFIKDEFIINIDAPVYDTKILNIRQTYTMEQLNDQLDIMINTAIKNGVYRLRIVVNIQSSLENFEAMKDFIITKLSNESMVKLVLSTDLDADAVDTMKESLNGSPDIDINESRSIDINMSIPEQVKDFIFKDTGKSIDVEIIKDHLDEKSL